MKIIADFPAKIVHDLPSETTAKDRIAIDIEMFGMTNSEKLHLTTEGRFASLQCTIDGKTVYIIDDEKEVPEFLNRIEKGVWILANAMFDIRHLRRWARVPDRRRLWDVIYIDQIMFSGYYDNFKLADITRRHLKTLLPKEAVKRFAEAEKMDRELYTYASHDVIATWHVYRAQKKIITQECLDVWKDIDLPAMWVLLSMPGIKLDVEKWRELALQNQAKADKFQNEDYPDINLNAPHQVLAHIHEIGYKDVENTREKTIKSLRDESEFVDDVLNYRTFATRANRYGLGIIDKYVQPDSRIYSSFRLIGAMTGRMASRSPNLMNIPVRETKEYRDCFIADEGNSLVVIDWSQQEPRVFAYFTQDPLLIDILKSDKDIYIECARLMMGLNLKKKDPLRSTRAKPTVLGASYGLTEYGLKREYDVPIEEGREWMEAFWETFHVAAKWAEKQRYTKKPFVETIYGRRFWLNRYVYKAERNALNAPVQGSAADAMKIAATRFYKEWGVEGKSPIVNFIHDEMIVEVAEEAAETTKQMLQRILVETAEEMHPGIPASVDIGIGKTWAKAKV